MDAAISELQKPFLDSGHIASSRTIMGLDTQLIEDQMYFIAEIDRDLAGCGGWSRRATLTGGDRSQGATHDCSIRKPKRRAPARCTRTRATHGKAWGG